MLVDIGNEIAIRQIELLQKGLPVGIVGKRIAVGVRLEQRSNRLVVRLLGLIDMLREFDTLCQYAVEELACGIELGMKLCSFGLCHFCTETLPLILLLQACPSFFVLGAG